MWAPCWNLGPRLGPSMLKPTCEGFGSLYAFHSQGTRQPEPPVCPLAALRVRDSSPGHPACRSRPTCLSWPLPTWGLSKEREGPAQPLSPHPEPWQDVSGLGTLGSQSNKLDCTPWQE